MTERKTLTTEARKRIRAVPPAAGMGREKGLKNKRTIIIENIMKHAHEGELPHEFLLRVARGQKIQHGEDAITGEPLFFMPSREERIDCAKAAAPYFAPRLSATEVIRGIDDEALLELIIGFAAAEGFSLNDLGAQQTPQLGYVPGDGSRGESQGHIIEQLPESAG